jgi:hypothetical protein
LICMLHAFKVLEGVMSYFFNYANREWVESLAFWYTISCTSQHDAHDTLLLLHACTVVVPLHHYSTLFLYWKSELSEGNTEKASLFTRAQFSRCHLIFASLL